MNLHPRIEPIRLSGRQNGKTTISDEIEALGRDLVAKGIPLEQAARIAPQLHMEVEAVADRHQDGADARAPLVIAVAG